MSLPYRVGFLALAIAPLVVACGGSRSLQGLLHTPTPHEQYANSLREAGLDSTALGREWLSAAEQSLGSAAPIETPFRESRYLPAYEATATSYRFNARRGQRIEVSVDLQSQSRLRLFLDLFEVSPDSAAELDHVEGRELFSFGVDAVPPSTPLLDWEPKRDATFVLRLQPELLRAGRFTVEIRNVASLAFPVSGKDSRAIRSRFGSERDGGRREHQGVDIFAARGTPVLAAADGFVRFVGTSSLGGLVVWLQDQSRGLALYYAHLDTQIVSAGQSVRAGDTLGLVGNTGNARATAPHLHFGIYVRGEGAVDPYAFVFEPPEEPAKLSADTSLLGDWGRASRAKVALRASPMGESARLAELPRHAALRITGASGGWFRVRLPDDREGYVPAQLTERANNPIRAAPLESGRVLRDRPDSTALVVDVMTDARNLPVLARFNEFFLVRSREGRLAWVEGSDER